MLWRLLWFILCVWSLLTMTTHTSTVQSPSKVSNPFLATQRRRVLARMPIFHNVSFRPSWKRNITGCWITFAPISFVDEEPSPHSSTVEHGAECDASLQQGDPGLSTPEKTNFRLSPEVPGPSHTSTDVGNWNYCLVQVGDVCVPGILPESLSSQIPLPHSELASLASININDIILFK